MINENLPKTSSNNFYQTTIIGHFEQARNIDNEASFLEGKINELEDQCEQYRETIRKEQIKYDKTLTQVRMSQTQKPVSFKSPIIITNNFEEDQNIRAAKREIKDLKFKLRRVKDQTLKYQTFVSFQLSEQQQKKIDFAQTISPQIANNLKNNFKNENDYNEQINELRNQISSLDKRKILANRILAMPIDDLYSNELLTEKAERSFLRLQQRYEETSPLKSKIDISDLELELKDMIYQNKLRQQSLQKKKNDLQKIKKELNYSNNENLASSLKTPKKKSSKNLPNQVVDKEHVDSLNTIYNKLKTRAEKIDAKEAETDQLIKGIEDMRSKMKDLYQQKMQKVSDLSFQFREIQNIQIKMHALAEKNSQLQLKLNDIEDEKSRIKRKGLNMSSSKSKILNQKSDLNSSKESFIELQNKVHSKEKELSQRKRRMAKMKEQTKKKSIELLLLKSRVDLLENQVSQMISNTNLRESEAKQETTELSISFVEKNDQQNSISFDLVSGSFT